MIILVFSLTSLVWSTVLYFSGGSVIVGMNVWFMKHQSCADRREALLSYCYWASFTDQTGGEWCVWLTVAGDTEADASLQCVSVNHLYFPVDDHWFTALQS